MARNFLRIFTENNPARGTGKKYNIPDVNWLTGYLSLNIKDEKQNVTQYEKMKIEILISISISSCKAYSKD